MIINLSDRRGNHLARSTDIAAEEVLVTLLLGAIVLIGMKYEL